MGRARTQLLGEKLGEADVEILLVLVGHVDLIVRTRTLSTCSSVSMERLTIAVLASNSQLYYQHGLPRKANRQNESLRPG